ncbi:MAG: glycogen-binding domain-containing protein [Gemmatimonadaceae bacterium]
MRRAPLAVSFLFAAMASAGAQWQLTGDAGAARLEQTGIPTSNALTAGATFDAYGSRASLRSSALIAYAGANRATGQALVLGSVLGEPGGAARWELAGAVSGFGQSNDVPTTSGEGMARVRFEGATTGFAFGAGAGAIERAGDANGLFHAQGDAYLVTNAGQWTANVSAVSIPSMITQRVVVQGSTLSQTGVRGTSYGDATLGWREERQRVEVGATAGLRSGFHGVVSTGGWGAADAAFWFTDRTAIVFGAGRTLDDATRGVPRATYASLSLRLAARPHMPSVVRDEPRGARVTVIALGNGRGRIEIRGVDGARLEVMGDFTSWQPVELERDGGVWRLAREMSAGLHRIAIRIDGGEWLAPANLPRANDDLGGSVGLITIP